MRSRQAAAMFGLRRSRRDVRASAQPPRCSGFGAAAAMDASELEALRTGSCEPA
jgi:hypothetical protein